MGCQDAPDYGKAASEAAEADIRTLPARKKLDRLAKLGEKGFVEFKDRKGRSVVEMVDFTGIGDIDLSRANLDFFIESAGTVSEAMLAQAEQYGVKFVEQRRKELQAADPEGFEMRQEMGKRIMEGGGKALCVGGERGHARGARQSIGPWKFIWQRSKHARSDGSW